MEALNYHHLFHFWTVAREGSIAKASRRLALSQPTISAQIHELEQSLGQKLFARAGRGLALTETGQTIYGYAERIFRLGDEMVDAIRQRRLAPRALPIQAGVDGTISRLLAHRMLAPALRHGQDGLVVREDALEPLLAQLALGTLDLVLSASPASGSKIKAHGHLLGECSFSLFALNSETAALRRRFPRSLEGAPMLLPLRGTSLRQAIDRWLEAERLHPEIVGEFEGTSLMKLWGKAGCGIFPAPSPVEREVQKQYGVTAIGQIPIKHRHYAFLAERTPRNPVVLAILKAAQAVFSA